MADSLNLVGDGDDIDVIRDVERAFGIQIADHEAEAIRTVGQLYDLIQAKCPGADRTQACLSQVAFYRLRRALAPTDKTAITPRTPIAIVHTVGGGSTAKAWTELTRRSGLTLPRLETPFTFAATPSLRITLGSVAIGVACFAAWAVVFRLPPLILLLGLPLLGIAVGLFVHAAFRDIPRRIQTIGDLAQEAAGYSYADVFKSSAAAGPVDRWHALTAILREISGYKPVITRDATFFTSDAAR